MYLLVAPRFGFELHRFMLSSFNFVSFNSGVFSILKPSPRQLSCKSLIFPSLSTFPVGSWTDLFGPAQQSEGESTELYLSGAEVGPTSPVDELLEPLFLGGFYLLTPGPIFLQHQLSGIKIWTAPVRLRDSHIQTLFQVSSVFYFIFILLN